MAGFFGFFDYSKPGRGISKDEPQKTGIALYFDILLRRFWKFITLNLLYLLFSVPAIAVIFFLSSEEVMRLASAVLDFSKISVDESRALLMLAAALAAIVFAIFGSGAASGAFSYVMNNYVNDRHSWIWSDFWEHLKKNFIQGTVVFVIDMVALVLFSVSLYFYSYCMPQKYLSLALRSVVVAVFLIFLMMHMYMYPIMAVFKLKIKDIYRNSLLLVMARLPWNFLAFAVSGGVLAALVYASLVSGIGILLFLFIGFALVGYTQMFMTNNIVKKYMLEPALAMENRDRKKHEDEESVFEDVTV